MPTLGEEFRQNYRLHRLIMKYSFSPRGKNTLLLNTFDLRRRESTPAVSFFNGINIV